MPHWRTMMDSDYLHAADLQGRDVVVVIEKVTQGEFTDFEDPKAKIRKPVVWFKDKKKPLGLNSTNARSIVKLFGSPETERWIGKAITIYPTTTRAFGEEHECIRVRNRLPSSRGGGDAHRTYEKSREQVTTEGDALVKAIAEKMQEGEHDDRD